jgi:hypothetical protein
MFIRNKRPWASYISVYLSINVIISLNLLRSKIMLYDELLRDPGSDPGSRSRQSRIPGLKICPGIAIPTNPLRNETQVFCEDEFL